MDRFKGVSTKYLNNYLVWFQFLEMKGFDATTANIKEILVSASLCDHHLTNQQIRHFESNRLIMFVYFPEQ